MVALPILRSVGGGLHPVGNLTISNYFTNPNLLDVSGGLFTTWYSTNCTFLPNAFTSPIHGVNSGKYTPLSTTSNYFYQPVAITPQDSWTFSAYFNIPVALTTEIDFIIIVYDNLGNSVDTVSSEAILPGVTTPGWVRSSITITMPTNAYSALFFVATSFLVTPTTLTPFYVSALQLEKSATVSTYGDGNMSGRLWSGAHNTSQTIQTEFPDAFNAFGTYPLAGGMGAAGSMYAPQYATLMD